MGTNKGVANAATIAELQISLTFLVYTPDCMVAFVPITPILQSEQLEATALATGSITLKTGIYFACFFTTLNATEEAELHAITIALQFLLIKNCVIFLLRFPMASSDFSP